MKIRVQKLFFFATILLSLFPVFPIFGKSIALAFWIALSLFTIIKGPYKRYKPIILLCSFASVYLFYFISVFYSNNLNYSVVYLFRVLPLLIFPLLFYFQPINFSTNEKNKILNTFHIALLVFISVIILYLISAGFINDFKNAKNPAVFFRHTLEAYTWLHSSYLSLFLCFSFIGIYIKLIEKWWVLSTIRKVLLIALLFYVLLIIIFLSAKMNIIALITATLLCSILITKSRLKIVLIILPVLFIIFGLIVSIPTTKFRFNNLIKAITTQEVDKKNPDSIRKNIYSSTFTLLKDNFVFGVGIGDVQDKLVVQYKRDKHKKAARRRFNTHNQYLHLWLAAGFLPFLFFVASLIFSIYLALCHKDYYYLGFLIIVSLNMVTENIISRQAGVLFFSFFNSLFAFNFTRRNDLLFINGRFLTQKITGVQRFAIEVCQELKQLKQILVLSPAKINDIKGTMDLPVKKIRFLKWHLWEQIALTAYLESLGSPLLLNLGNMAPVSYKNKIVTIHDLAFYKNPKWYSKSFVWLYRFLIPKILKSSIKILTVSHFSKNEILRTFHIGEQKVEVVYNGVPGSIQKEVINNEGLPKKYILTVGSINPRKNINRLIEAFIEAELSDFKLVIVGKSNAKIYKATNLDKDKLKKYNIEYLDTVSDKLLSKLYKNASLFVYLPHYEGFGVPILEAMFFGCPTLISNIQVFKEIYKNGAFYVDQNDVEQISNSLKKVLLGQVDVEKKLEISKEIINIYDYKITASKINNIINNLN